MQLEKIIELIRSELETEDKIKEELVEKARLGIRSCGDAVIYAHRNNLDKSKEKIKEAQNLIAEVKTMLKTLPHISNYNIITDLYQEFVEAVTFIGFLEKKLYIDYRELDVPAKAYVLGLADVIGELRRYVLNSIRRGKIDDAEYALDVMEEIFDNIYTLETPKSFVSGLRRKSDIARAIIEKTRGDVTNAISNLRLINRLKEFKEKL
ncbi:MAG: hypothetical protein ACTSQY_01945 [Candidatus Odinarchaeia archaeon]